MCLCATTTPILPRDRRQPSFEEGPGGSVSEAASSTERFYRMARTKSVSTHCKETGFHSFALGNGNSDGARYRFFLRFRFLFASGFPVRFPFFLLFSLRKLGTRSSSAVSFFSAPTTQCAYPLLLCASPLLRFPASLSSKSARRCPLYQTFPCWTARCPQSPRRGQGPKQRFPRQASSQTALAAVRRREPRRCPRRRR